MEITIKFNTDLPEDNIQQLQALICEFVNSMEQAGIDVQDITVDGK